MRLIVLLVVLLVIAGCGAGPIGINDPREAVAFWCAISADHPEAGLCLISQGECEGAVTNAARTGLFLSPCAAQPRAWCGVGRRPDGRDLWSCGVDRLQCLHRLEVDRRESKTSNLGECMDRTAGSL